MLSTRNYFPNQNLQPVCTSKTPKETATEGKNKKSDEDTKVKEKNLAQQMVFKGIEIGGYTGAGVLGVLSTFELREAYKAKKGLSTREVNFWPDSSKSYGKKCSKTGLITLVGAVLFGLFGKLGTEKQK